MSERLQKILSRAGAAVSRRKAEDLIREGRVTVNGRVATLGDSADPAEDHIKLDGKRIALPSSYHYLLLNKPPEVMSTRADPEGRRTVMDFVPPGLRRKVVPVGRLDYHTEGLLLLTDDGDLAHRVSHPRHGFIKTYEVKVRGVPAEAALDKVRAGMRLEGRKTRPVEVTRSPAARGPRVATQNTWLVVELKEGRTRQIREVFLRIGHPVQRLRRVAIGPVRDPRLPPGQIRELTDDEIDRLRGKARKPARTKPGKKPAPQKSSSKRSSSRKPSSRKPSSRKPSSRKPSSRESSSRKSSSKKPSPRKPKR